MNKRVVLKAKGNLTSKIIYFFLLYKVFKYAKTLSLQIPSVTHNAEGKNPFGRKTIKHLISDANFTFETETDNRHSRNKINNLINVLSAVFAVLPLRFVFFNFFFFFFFFFFWFNSGLSLGL